MKYLSAAEMKELKAPQPVLPAIDGKLPWDWIYRKIHTAASVFGEKKTSWHLATFGASDIDDAAKGHLKKLGYKWSIDEFSKNVKDSHWLNISWE